MYMSQKLREHYLTQVKLALDCLPDGIYFDFDGAYVNLQANNLDKVRETRRYFPPAVWKKEYRESCQWWEYIAEFNGVFVRIYACKEVPLTCKLVEEEYEAEVDVPVEYAKKEVEVAIKFEKQKVMRKRTRMQCEERELVPA